jgi:hypothetical protein
MATRIGRGRRSPGNIESVPGARDIVRRDTGHLAALKAPDDMAWILLNDVA